MNPQSQSQSQSQAPLPEPAHEPEPVQVDDKDWTWVLSESCPDCGADVGRMSVSEVADENRSNAEAWKVLLGGDENWLRARPEPAVWSPLEYACHVRDVFRLFLVRLDLMLTDPAPEFANWNPNITASEERYDLSDPAEVANELVTAAQALATALDSITENQMALTGRRGDGAVFSIESFAQYEIHDPIHHLWDVQANG